MGDDPVRISAVEEWRRVTQLSPDPKRRPVEELAVKRAELAARREPYAPQQPAMPASPTQAEGPVGERTDTDLAWLERAGLFAPWRLADFPDDVRRPTDAFLDALRAQRPDMAPFNLVVIGQLGRRKTSLAWAIAHQVRQAGRTFRIVEAGDFAASLLPDGGATPDDYIRPAVLVIDDVGTVDLTTPGRADVTMRVLDRRYWRARPTIITTNLDEHELPGVLGERPWDRLTHRWALVRLAGPNYRHLPAVPAAAADTTGEVVELRPGTASRRTS